MPEHGGRLLAASRRLGRPAADWLDLSTGINPDPWPVPSLPPAAWHRLPEPDDDLIDAARACYGCQAVLPVAGSQAAIQALPRLRGPSRVAVVGPTYAEHAHAWRRAGHRVLQIARAEIDGALERVDVLVIVNPDNPTGCHVDTARLRGWHRRLARRGGWLIVDEAFADALPAPDLAAGTPAAGLVILRSLGKFFGLAGLRVGFVIAAHDLLRRLDDWLGPWTLARPSRELASLALADRDWQARARSALAARAASLDALLRRHALHAEGLCPLIRYVPTPHAEALATRLAQHGILVRRFDDRPALRFGLPRDDAARERLDVALSAPESA